MSANAKNSTPHQPGSTARGTGGNALPPLKALIAFEAASRHGSFSQGADELGVTPSAVSHQIQQLEAFLGIVLFQRRAGRVAVTNAGATYAEEIERAFGIILGATRLVAPQSQRGHLVIASGPSFASKWLQPKLAGFLAAHPAIRVRLSTLTDRDSVVSDRFDIAIAYGRPPETSRHVEPLLVERLRPLCSPQFAARLSLQHPADLKRATLIHSVNALTWTDYLRRIGEPGLRPANELWLDRSTMAIEAAVGSLGIVLESDVLAHEEIRSGTLVAPFGEDIFKVEVVTYYLVRERSHRLGAQIAAFETWLRQSIAPANLASSSAPTTAWDYAEAGVSTAAASRLSEGR